MPFERSFGSLRILRLRERVANAKFQYCEGVSVPNKDIDSPTISDICWGHTIMRVLQEMYIFSKDGDIINPCRDVNFILVLIW